MLNGSCLCGTVRFEIDGRITPLQYCHCGRCRKSSGSAFVAAIAAPTKAFRWVAGGDAVVQFEAPVREEPPGFRTAFCRACGTPLPLHDPEEPFVIIPAGCLDDDPELQPFRHIFVAHKAPWYEIRDDLPQFPDRLPPEKRLPRKPR